MSDASIIFDGINGVTSDTFVRMTRQRSLAEGKQKDDEWIALSAASFLEGQALAWYELQSEEIQESWKLLRRALLAQWPPPTVTVHPSNAATAIPTPAAAPPSGSPAAANQNTGRGSQLPVSDTVAASSGFIRLSRKSGEHLGYLSENTYRGAYTMTSQRSGAAVVNIRSSGLVNQFRIASSNGDALGVKYNDSRTHSSLEAVFSTGGIWWSTLFGLKEDLSARFGWRGAGMGGSPGLNGDGDMWLILRNNVVFPMWKAPNGAIYPFDVFLTSTIIGAAANEIAVTNTSEKMKLDRELHGYNHIHIDMVFEPL